MLSVSRSGRVVSGRFVLGGLCGRVRPDYDGSE